MYYNTKQNFGGSYLRYLIHTILIILISTAAIFAQTGKITGKIVDAETGEAVIGCNVLIDGTTMGAAAGIEGTYSIKNVPAGTYDLVFSSVGYTKKTVTDVKVISGSATKIDIILPIESFETDEVVITAEAAKNTEAGLLISRQKSNAVSDAISSEQFSRSGAGNAADAVKQVVGASVVDGKYVFVRGLGDRYSSTQLNGAELPSSDPNRKAFHMDLLPTNLLENIVTIKTFTPDKPGSFSGGIVDIGTKNFPKEFTLKFSTSSSVNSFATFNENNISYEGVEGDFLGFDTGLRDIPSFLTDPDIEIPIEQQARFDEELALKLDKASKSFNNVMDLQRKTAPLNRSFSFSIGEDLSTGEESSFGYLGSLTYSRNFSFYDDGKIGRYILTGAGKKS
ncbi:MAG: carboxypeptidase-like regulatory domain-containing protein [Melioribacteraceae bacterium]|nr:carboxypeptidase-like regulatory domain-containing protein [Melioribacteraceae bacterium]